MAECIPGPNRFDSFDIFQTYYKDIHGHAIEVGILIPHSITLGIHPVFVKFHGGGCVSGTWSYPNWFANWLVPLMHRHKAIVVSPNYRLLPEHNGHDIQQDLADFWVWFKAGGVTKYLQSRNVEIELDYTRVMAAGDSAGGYLAIHSGLTQPMGTIKAILGCYPMTNYLRRKPQPFFMNEPSPPESIIDEHIEHINPGTVISGAPPRPRNRISYALSAYGRYNEFFGSGEDLWPISLLPLVKQLPSTIIVHGTADTAVNIDDSRTFVTTAGEVLGEDADIILVQREGEDHGFDMDATEDEEWVKDVMKWAEVKWIK